MHLSDMDGEASSFEGTIAVLTEKSSPWNWSRSTPDPDSWGTGGACTDGDDRRLRREWVVSFLGADGLLTIHRSPRYCGKRTA